MFAVDQLLNRIFSMEVATYPELNSMVLKLISVRKGVPGYGAYANISSELRIYYY